MSSASSESIPNFATSVQDKSSFEERPTTHSNVSNVPPEQASSLAFTTTRMDPGKILTAVQLEISGRDVEPISAQEFLDRYLPPASPPSAPERPDHKGPMTALAQEMPGIKRQIQNDKGTYMGAPSPTDHSTRAFTALCKKTQKLVNTRPFITLEAAEIFPKENDPKIRHYRSVLVDVGHDLRTFSSVKQLVKVIHDATIAYDHAFFGAGVLHRDISIGNITISDDGTGLLIDWDLCKDTNSAPQSEERAMKRIGTWQFAAARLLLENDNEPPQNREDGLESFYHLLNWMALRHTPHSLSSEMLTYELDRIFDDSYRSHDGRAAGGMAKISEILSGFSNKFAAFMNQPLGKLLETIRNLVAFRYKADQVDIDRYKSKMNKLSKQGEFTSLFAETLTSDEDWITNGARLDHNIGDLHVRYMSLY